MANQFASGETYADGQTVNAARLNNTVNLATAQPGLITEQGLVTPVPADQILLEQASSGLLKRATLGAIAGLPAYFQGSSAAPTGTSSTTGVMMGLPGTITTMYTGRILVIASGGISNDANSLTADVQIWVGSGTKPNNGDALTGVAFGAPTLVRNASTAGMIVPFVVQAAIPGLTLGVAFWLDVSLSTSGGSNAQIYQATITAIEF